MMRLFYFFNVFICYMFLSVSCKEKQDIPVVDIKPTIFKIILNSDGGKLGVGYQNVIENEQYRLACPEKEGYSFVAWSYDGIKITDIAGNSLTGYNFKKDITANAVWQRNGYKISFNKLGGTLAEGYKNVIFNSNYILPVPKKIGYVFEGWQYNGIKITDCFGVGLSPYTFPENIGATAVWGQNIFVINLNPKGGTLTENYKNVGFDSNYILPVPRRVGYIFQGWRHNGVKITDLLGCSLLPYSFTEDITAIASWAYDVFTVNLNPNGGTLTESYKNIVFNTDYILPIPKKIGCVFEGWQHNGVKITNSLGVSLLPYNFENITAIADWSYKILTVNLDPNGGTVSVSSYQVEYGASNIQFSKPIRSGYSFKGWWTQTEGGEKKTDDNGLMADKFLSENNVIYYAQWVKCPDTPVISFSDQSLQIPYARGFIYVSGTGDVTLQYQVNGGNWTNYAGRINIKTLGNGSNNFNVRSIDNVTGLITTHYDTITYNGNKPTDSKKWLDHISNYVKISQLSIPGTHESGAVIDPTFAFGFAQCQSSSILDQLNLGCRVIDVRINEDMAIYHGSFYMGHDFGSVVNEVTQFLNANPSEFVIMSIKDENNSGGQESWTNKVNTEIAKSSRAASGLTSKNFTVGEIRGKFIILRRFGYIWDRGIDVSGWPNDWYDQNPRGTSPMLLIQDAYNFDTDGYNRKKGHIDSHLERLKNHQAYYNGEVIGINFTSATKYATPGQFAADINPWMINKLNYCLQQQSNNGEQFHFGITMTDFAGRNPDLTKNLFLINNFRGL